MNRPTANNAATRHGCRFPPDGAGRDTLLELGAGPSVGIDLSNGRGECGLTDRAQAAGAAPVGARSWNRRQETSQRGNTIPPYLSVPASYKRAVSPRLSGNFRLTARPARASEPEAETADARANGVLIASTSPQPSDAPLTKRAESRTPPMAPHPATRGSDH